VVGRLLIGRTDRYELSGLSEKWPFGWSSDFDHQRNLTHSWCKAFWCKLLRTTRKLSCFPVLLSKFIEISILIMFYRRRIQTTLPGLCNDRDRTCWIHGAQNKSWRSCRSTWNRKCFIKRNPWRNSRKVSFWNGKILWRNYFEE